MNEPLATLEQGKCKAEIYDIGMPGQFMIRYYGQDGKVLAEEPLTGVSSYKQREQEIRDHIAKLCGGHSLDGTPLSDSGEY